MNKNEKGFTLVELLAVIVILALIALIAYPNVAKIISNAKKNTKKIQFASLKDAAETYVARHAAELGDNDEVCVSDLKEDGLIENVTIINPENNEEYDGCFEITWDSDYNQYNYSYND